MWERLVGQEAAVAALRDATARTHAYLFAGPDGVGRDLAALALAATLNCDEGGCGVCASCEKILRRAHPDVRMTGAEGAQVLVDQVRAIRAAAYLSPVEGRVKVFIVSDAHKLNPAASNALLKVLEEPPGDVVIVLITEAPEDLLETVVSRCRRIDFSPMSPTAIQTVLVDQHGAAQADAEWAARTGGDVARALRFVKDPEARDRREAHLAIAGRLVRGGLPEAITIAAEVAAEATAATQVLAALQKKEVVELAEALGDGRGTAAARKRLEDRHKRELRRRETEAYDSALRDIGSFYRDVLLLGAGASADTLVNREWAERLERASVVADPAWLAEAIERIESTRRAIGRTAMPGLALESLFMHLGTPRARVSA